MADMARINLVLPAAARARSRASSALSCGLTEGQITHRLQIGHHGPRSVRVSTPWRACRHLGSSPLFAVTLSMPPGPSPRMPRTAQAVGACAGSSRSADLRSRSVLPLGTDVAPRRRRSAAARGALFDADLTFARSRSPRSPWQPSHRRRVRSSDARRSSGYIVDDALRRKLAHARGVSGAVRRTVGDPRQDARMRRDATASSANRLPGYSPGDSDLETAPSVALAGRCRATAATTAVPDACSQGDVSGSTWPTQSSGSPSSSTVGTHIDSAPRSTPTTVGRDDLSRRRVVAGDVHLGHDGRVPGVGGRAAVPAAPWPRPRDSPRHSAAIARTVGEEVG